MPETHGMLQNIAEYCGNHWNTQCSPSRIPWKPFRTPGKHQEYVGKVLRMFWKSLTGSGKGWIKEKERTRNEGKVGE